MYVDASAMTALILHEADRDEILEKMASAPGRQTSVVSVFETMLAVGRERGDREGALALVRRLIEGSGIAVQPVDAGLLDYLSEAYVQYGKGSGHPARLNLGDCFSYAMAKRAGVPLLYKDNDFALTDMA